MQNAKDTFYEALRTRLTALNPERTVVVRGVTRPALLAVENELEMTTTPADCFLLRWTAMSTSSEHALPLVTLRCELGYETAGSGWNGGMDRGRLLATMDGELLAMLTQSPASAPKFDYAPLAATTGSQDPQPMGTRIWWSEPAFGAMTMKRDRVARTATVDVMSYEQGGEL